MAFTAKMAFSPPKYCRLFAQKKAYQGGVTGPPGPPPPPSYAPAGPLLGKDPLWFDSCKQPHPGGDSVFAFWVVAFSRFNCM